MVHLCETCEEPAKRRCSDCKTPSAWYCSKECQRTLWSIHIFDCNPNKQINTAYRLHRAVFEDAIPDDLEVCRDYGFEKAFSPRNRTMLFGLYIGLMKYSYVEPSTVHKWRVNGRLIEGIKEEFEKDPADNRGEYYPWFLQNQWVLDSGSPPPQDYLLSMVMRAWKYVGGSASVSTVDGVNAIKATWPREKQQCFDFCACILSEYTPNPSQESQDIWLALGFCVCQDKNREDPLFRLYRDLLAKSTFDDIYTAYSSSSLIALLDCKGLKNDRERIRHLDDVLAGPLGWKKSVWDLVKYTEEKDGELIPSVTLDYGFANCKGEREILELKEVYRQLFIYRFMGADPIELHEAAIGGRLFEYVGRFVMLEKKFSRIMKNPYPLNF